MGVVNILLWLWLSVATVFGAQNVVVGKQSTGNRPSCNNGPNSIASGNCDKNTPNIFVKTPERVMRDGYPVETHTVTTEDGYLLTVHRIPGSPRAASSGVKTPVLVQHGILAASDFWLITGPENALESLAEISRTLPRPGGNIARNLTFYRIRNPGFLLADQGYDVWLGNARGNVYSRKHVTLSPKDPKFWDFSWHEMGVYDLPAVIDHILETTNQKQLFYIGHSMGTTMFFVLTSTKPEYNAKIRLMVALAPVVFANAMIARNINSKLGLPFAETLYRVFKNARQGELLPRTKAIGRLLEEACSDGRKTQPLCRLIYYTAYGNDGGLLNKTMLPEFFYFVQSGMSLDTLYHFVQIIKTGRFQLFDKSGKVDGIMPEYNLTEVTAPVSLHFATHDIWSAREGVFPLSKRVRNAIKIVRLPDDRLNHNDYGYAINAKELIYKEIFNLFANN